MDNKIDEILKALEDLSSQLAKSSSPAKPIDSQYGADKETQNFLENWEPPTKHPLEPTAGMPKSNKKGQRTTPSGFKLKLLKEEKLCFSKGGQWSLDKSNYGPKGMNLYSPVDNQNRKANNTGDSIKDAGKNTNVKTYTTTGSSVSQAHEAAQNKEQKEKSKASLRTFADMSEEEKNALRAKYEIKKSQNTIQLQPTDQELFGHLVTSTTSLAKQDEEWKNRFKGLSFNEKIDHLNKSKVDDIQWGNGRSFNSIIKDELSDEEMALRNLDIGE